MASNNGQKEAIFACLGGAFQRVYDNASVLTRPIPIMANRDGGLPLVSVRMGEPLFSRNSYCEGQDCIRLLQNRLMMREVKDEHL